jgi:hypothetical protein
MTPVDHDIKQSGLITRDSGQQVSYGIPYEILPTVTSLKSTIPMATRKIIKKIEEQSQLRMDMKEYNPVFFLCFASF